MSKMSSILGNEGFGFQFEEEDGASVSIEQTIEVETEVADQAEEAAEVVEAAEAGEDNAEAIEEMLATFDEVERMYAVVEEFGWCRPVAAMFNPTMEGQTTGSLEAMIGVSLPSNESLEMVGSRHDAVTMEVLDSMKKGLNKFWTMIKNAAKSVWEFLKNIGSRIMSLFTGIDRTAGKLAYAIGKMTVDEDKLKDKKFKGMSYPKWNGLAAAAEKLSSGESIAALGVTVVDGVVKNEGSDKFKTDSINLKGSGFETHVGSKTRIADLMKSAREYEKLAAQGVRYAKDCMDIAVKHEKAQGNGSDAVGAAKEKAKEKIKEVKNTQKIVAIGMKTTVKLAKIFIAAQRAYLSCKK